MANFTEIQSQFCSNYNQRKLCSYDVEYIDSATRPLLHQTSRFIFFQSGKGEISIDNRKYEIRPNTFLVILPWETSEINKVDEPLQLIKCVFNSDFVTQSMKLTYNTKNELFSVLTPIGNSPIIYCTDAEANKILSILYEIKDEVGIESLYDIQEEKELSSIYVTNKLCELLILFKRLLTKKDITHHDGTPVELDQRNNLFKYMYSHLSEKQTLTKLSGMLYMSESTISKYISDVTGYTFSNLLTEMRLVKCMDLLTYTNMNISEIAETTGFTDASHVSKLFSERTGMTLKKFRDIYQNNAGIFGEKEKSLSFNVINFIYSNYMEDINISDVVQKFSITTIELNRILLFQVEKNFEDFITFLRITKACELLLTTDKEITEIAFMVGYQTVRTFNRNFISIKKMNPSTFRKKVLFQKESESILIEKIN